MTNEEIIDTWRDQPAPLLPVLHAIHDRDGELSDDALRDVATGLRQSLADLYGTVTFYHHFSRAPRSTRSPRVCTGPVCRSLGAKSILATLEPQGAIAMPCPGRCDDPVPVLSEGRVDIYGANGEVTTPPSALPAPNPAGLEECVFCYIREPGRSTLDGYRRNEGYLALKQAKEMGPEAVREVVKESGLVGRGGAGFPTGTKWSAVAEAAGTPKTIVCNADEGEPGCFQDRAVMDYDPHAVIEGMLIAGLATGAERGIIYLRYEYPDTFKTLERAIEEARADGLIGPHALGSDQPFDLHLRRGAGAYICGEETSLLNSLEGKHPYPRNRPPYPVTNGFEDLPTAVNNVETLAVVPKVLVNGASWYQNLGCGSFAGTKIISVSGDIERPGNYEVPIGFSLRELLDDWAGGATDGRSIQAVTMAGLSGGFLAGPDLDVTLDAEAIQEKGGLFGAAGIMVFDDRHDMVEVARDVMHFFADESCGKCFPCRIGTQRLLERLEGSHGPGSPEGWHEEINDIATVMKATSACGLGQAAPLIVESCVKYFPESVAAHIRRGGDSQHA